MHCFHWHLAFIFLNKLDLKGDLMKKKMEADRARILEIQNENILDRLMDRLLKVGYDSGFDDGRSSGLKEGRSIGHKEGFREGHEIGHDEGFEKGQGELARMKARVRKEFREKYPNLFRLANSSNADGE